MNKSLRALALALFLLAFLTALAGADPAVANLEVTNIDGLWSNPSPAGINTNPCYGLENTGPTTDENKIYAGQVNNDSSNCYTDPPYNAAPYNNGAGYSEGSGFGFDGKNGPLSIPPSTPFLLGLFTHYNRRIASNSGLDGAQIDIVADITGASPASPAFQYTVTLDETPNNPDGNPNNTCPYPAGSFYSTAYLDFNGRFDEFTYTFGTPFDHSSVNGNPPFAERDANQWLCGDKITATLVGGNEVIFSVGSDNYTLVLLGSSYPVVNPLNAPTGVSDLEICGDYPGPGSADLDLETKELTDTQGCIWAQFTAPSAVSLGDVSASSGSPALLPAGLLLLAALASLALARRAR